jgi:hypothetical protein
MGWHWHKPTIIELLVLVTCALMIGSLFIPPVQTNCERFSPAYRAARQAELAAESQK